VPSVQTLDIRELRNNEDLRNAFVIVKQLRDHLDFSEFKKRIERQWCMRYMLFGAFHKDGFLYGVIGMRPVTTLARGDHLHIDDLIVNPSFQRKGIGHTLMTFAEEWAITNNLRSVFLDSRPEVLPFYTTLHYKPHTAILLRKRLPCQLTINKGRLNNE